MKRTHRRSAVARRVLAGLVFALTAAACASSGEGRPSGSPDLINRAQIEASSARTAFDLVNQIRPQWLRSRGTGSIQNPDAGVPVVYVGEVRHGDVESLRGFDPDGIEEIRFINATSATTRYGSGHSGGVIRITLRR
jgi:hypothetical protein